MSRILSISVPTFILKKIDPEQLVEKYNQGEFQSISIHKENVQVKNAIKIIGTGIHDSVYSCRDKNNVVHTIATTNCDRYEHLATDEHVCDWCRLKFTHQEIGIPISYKNEHGVLTFYTEGTYCDFPCALADLFRTRGPSLRYYDVAYGDSETLLRLWYFKIRPDEVLKPAPHFRLLKRNGGSLEEHEYYNRNLTYIKIPGIITLPAKQQYLMIRHLMSGRPDGQTLQRLSAETGTCPQSTGKTLSKS